MQMTALAKLAVCFLFGIVSTLTLAQALKIEKFDFKANNVTVLGELRIPPQQDGAKLPLVFVLPNAGGLDGTGPQYIAALNQRGIATIELNLLAEASWGKNVIMSLAATRVAVDKFGIDPFRVGMMGFSHGAMVSLIAATEHWMKPLLRGSQFRFKAFAVLYPLCSLMNDAHSADYINWKTTRVAESGEKNVHKGLFEQMTGGRLLLLVGEKDDYEDAPVECPKLLDIINKNSPGLARLTIYPGVGHGWDVPSDRTYRDSVSRKNGTIRHFRYQSTFELSRSAVVDFFAAEFQLN